MFGDILTKLSKIACHSGTAANFVGETGKRGIQKGNNFREFPKPRFRHSKRDVKSLAYPGKFNFESCLLFIQSNCAKNRGLWAEI